jgi:hypothetical protein
MNKTVVGSGTETAIAATEQARAQLAKIAIATETNKDAGDMIGKVWQACNDFKTMAELNPDPVLVHSIAIAKSVFGSRTWFYDGFFVAASPACHGQGLYTMFPIPRGYVIGEYEGVLRTPDEYNRLNKAKFAYGLEVIDHDGKEYIIDPTNNKGKVLRGAKYRLAYINEPPEDTIANCTCLPVPTRKDRLPQAQIITTAYVPPFAELWWFYGQAYKRNYAVGKPARCIKFD